MTDRKKAGGSGRGSLGRRGRSLEAAGGRSNSRGGFVTRRSLHGGQENGVNDKSEQDTIRNNRSARVDCRQHSGDSRCDRETRKVDNEGQIGQNRQRDKIKTRSFERLISEADLTIRDGKDDNLNNGDRHSIVSRSSRANRRQRLNDSHTVSEQRKVDNEGKNGQKNGKKDGVGENLSVLRHHSIERRGSRKGRIVINEGNTRLGKASASRHTRSLKRGVMMDISFLDTYHENDFNTEGAHGGQGNDVNDKSEQDTIRDDSSARAIQRQSLDDSRRDREQRKSWGRHISEADISLQEDKIDDLNNEGIHSNVRDDRSARANWRQRFDDSRSDSEQRKVENEGKNKRDRKLTERPTTSSERVIPIGSAQGNHIHTFAWRRGGTEGCHHGNERHNERGTTRRLNPTRSLERPALVDFGSSHDGQNDDFDETGRRGRVNSNFSAQGSCGRNNIGRHSGGEGTNRQNAQRKSIGTRGSRPLELTIPFLRDLEEREPADIIMTLSHTNTDFSRALKKCANDDQMLGLLISVLASAFTCNSMPEQLHSVLTLIKEETFLDTASRFFICMSSEKSPIKQKTFRKPIIDMITIMSEIIQMNPTAVTQTLGAHAVLQITIDALGKSSSVIDGDILGAFREFTDHKDRLLTRNTRKRRPQAEENEDEDIEEEEEENPPEDYREIEIFPQWADMQERRDDIYLRPNKVQGKYRNLDHYLDVQFRLLREDFIGPLRDGVSEYKQAVIERDKDKHNQDIRIYERVQLVSPVCGDDGIHHQIQFDVSRLRNICWKSTKRLIYGSLVCLSPDNFDTFYFATVLDRKPELLESGLITVHFEHSHQEINDMYGTDFTMAETTAYFESYRHVLTGLKHFRQGDLPFEKYIISCESQVEAPAYIRRHHRVKYDLRPLVDEDIVLQGDNKLKSFRGTTLRRKQSTLQFTGHSAQAAAVEILDKESWPSAEMLHLDESQYKAIRTALTKEFVITQGPPGTGKTYIGLKIVKTLLHNKRKWSANPHTGREDPRPMLIVCYTNHALDQFLEGIVKFYKDDVIRVGGRCNSTTLEAYSLNNFRQRFRETKKSTIAVYNSRRDAMSEMDNAFSEITNICVSIQIATTNVLREDYLQPFMGSHYPKLIYQFHKMLKEIQDETGYENEPGFSVIAEWLGLGNCISIDEFDFYDTTQEYNDQDQTEETINVEDVIDFMQEKRKNDYDDDNDDIIYDEYGDVKLTRKQKKEAIVSKANKGGRKAIAYDSATQDKKQKGMPKGAWQTQKQQRKKMKRFVQNNLRNSDVMTEEEASQIHDLMRMPMSDKWRLYRLWKKKYCDHYLSRIERIQIEYEAAAARYKEARMQEDKEILKCSTVIGMTTTGAARYQAILQEIQPRIVVVEEAAEVLEAHIITTLSRGCEHLILIGDHKQLKPSPTVFELARKYNLDISLFERMVTNDLRCDCLELQHRMRPEISQLMRHIYSRYIDHDHVKQYENIKGVSTNLYFINHNELEAHDEDLRSHSNVFEAEYIVALCRYFLQQGYEPEQITVLTTYSGQLFKLKNLMPKTQFDGVKVTVVDNYQGEENDIILLSLVRSNLNGNIGFLKIENRVCVALSRAKKGLYVIGNFDMLSKCGKSKLWRELVVDMRTKNFLGDGLSLYCQNHPNDGGIVASCKADFEKAPEGGCMKRCEARLECGHACTMYCHVIDVDHTDYECMKKCERKMCEKGHSCPKKCFEICGECIVSIEKIIPKCGHRQVVPCFKRPEDFICQEKCTTVLSCGHPCQTPCGMPHTTECRSIVKNEWPCGYKADIYCFRAKEAPCPKPCEKVLECGHICSGTCGKCFKGRLHMPCKNKCTRILVCGHQCTSSCNRCPPCTRKCENRCIHSYCSKTCGELCQPCMEPCEWQCEHYKCTKRCHEPCNRPRCDRPCKKKLDCGHQCIGLCGEPCPTDCRVCDSEKVTKIMFGYEDEPDARFVLLQDCKKKCIIESKSMDKYMDSVSSDEDAIVFKLCPICRTAIRKNNRYGSIINKTLQDIESVKRKVLTSRSRIYRLEHEIKDLLKDRSSLGLNNCRDILEILLNMREPKTESALIAIKNQVGTLKTIKKLELDWEKLGGIEYLPEKQKMAEFFERFEDWAKRERDVMTAQEIDDIECELLRSEHKLKVFLHEISFKENDSTKDRNMCKTLDTLKGILEKAQPYKGEHRETVQEGLKRLPPLMGLGIDDEERKMIVQAMALPSGHWFKCPKGHVYAIGDCGGATVEGRCPDCKSTIGGTRHNLRSDNQLAPEMDSARHPAWSEQANLVNYGFEAQF